ASERQNNAVMRYQALKRKPLNEAQARKNMMIYLKNMAGFKMNFFKGMIYSEIRPLFEKHYNSNQAFLEKVEEEVIVEEKEIEEEGNKRQEATPLASKVSVVDYQIHHENNKSYYKIISVDGSHKLFLSFITSLKNFDREDLETLWKLIKERLEVEEESEISLELLRLVRRQLNEGMQDIDEEEPAKVEEVLEVVTAAKLIKQVVTTTEPTTTAAQVPKVSAPRRRRGVVIVESNINAARLKLKLFKNIAAIEDITK
nr:hypothetical protein [Tanacetum cinerariifolium]